MEVNNFSVIYKSLDSVLTHLRKQEYNNLQAVQKLLDLYEVAINENLDAQEPKYPLIVLEGLDGCGKSTISKRLSAEIDGLLFCTPPPCIKPIRDEFDSPEYKEVRTAYYALGNYIAALQMKTMLQTKPVILDRYWHSTAAYALAQAVADNPENFTLPSAENPIYQWPEDLMQPNVVIFLSVGENVRLERLKNRTQLTDQENLLEHQMKFRSNVLAVYNSITPKIKMINGQLSKRKTTEQVIMLIKPFLS